MSDLLYVDKSKNGEKIRGALKNLQALEVCMIEDPRTVDFVLPILFTTYGSFEGNRIKDYLELRKFYKQKNKINKKNGELDEDPVDRDIALLSKRVMKEISDSSLHEESG